MTSRDDEHYRVIAMHPALVADFEAWLRRRGLELREAPNGTWIVTPTDHTLRYGPPLP